MEAQLLATLIVALVLWIVYGQPECRMQQGTSTTYQAAPVERTRAVSFSDLRSAAKAISKTNTRLLMSTRGQASTPDLADSAGRSAMSDRTRRERSRSAGDQTGKRRGEVRSKSIR